MYQRASLIAFSFASAPPFVKNAIAVVARGHLGEEPSQLGAPLVVAERRCDRAELAGLRLDRRDELGMLMADVDVDQLRREVEVALAVEVPDVAALGAGDRHGVDLVLHRPGVEDVLLRVLDDLRPEVRIRRDGSGFPCRS